MWCGVEKTGGKPRGAAGLAEVAAATEAVEAKQARDKEAGEKAPRRCGAGSWQGDPRRSGSPAAVVCVCVVGVKEGLKWEGGPLNRRA